MIREDKKKIILLSVVIVFVITAILLIASSCNCDNKPFHGYIVDKEFIPEHTEKHGKRRKRVPDTYCIYVANKTGVVKFEVCENKYEELKQGDTITIK